jgi:hypothetical protein
MRLLLCFQCYYEYRPAVLNATLWPMMMDFFLFKPSSMIFLDYSYVIYLLSLCVSFPALHAITLSLAWHDVASHWKTGNLIVTLSRTLFPFPITTNPSRSHLSLLDCPSFSLSISPSSSILSHTGLRPVAARPDARRRQADRGAPRRHRPGRDDRCGDRGTRGDAADAADQVESGSQHAQRFFGWSASPLINGHTSRMACHGKNHSCSRH